MKKLHYCLLMILTFCVQISGWSQNSEEPEALFTKNINEVYNNPVQTSRVANYLLSNSKTAEQRAKAFYLKSTVSFLFGEVTEGQAYLLQAKDEFELHESNFINALLNIALAERYQKAGMTESAVNFINTAKTIAKKLTEEEKVIILQICALLKNNGLTVFDDIYDASKYEKYAALKAIIRNNLGFNYLNKKDLDKAQFSFNYNILELKNNALDNSAITATSLQGLGDITFLKKDFTTSKLYFLKALEQPVMFPETRYAIQNKLAAIYKMQDSMTISQKYNSENISLKSEILKSERSARILLIEYLEKGQNASIKNDMNLYYVLVKIIFVLLLILLIWYYFYNKKLDKEYIQFEKIINQIENKEKLELNITTKEAVVSKVSKGVLIPIETEKAILDRLDVFENSTDYTNSNMSLALLAKQLKTNKKYISEIIHNHKGKNFNTYINELRINYIIKLMQDDPEYLKYKVSYLAKKSGFSSHSAFTVVFKSITNITPKQFVMFLKKSSKVSS
ncbi:helix-turn-helix domain-containing protein [Patiriisocius marinus]|uniref:helix-turn-helix domain-containing protein n=1 Tax=Patiriisocius marinus TaxID=1397112 RepID=UPI002330DEA8|nr:helix-turn-helix domain-containing protein [Patiriisocius marinus]